MNEDIGSDSAFLDNVIELLTHCSNRDIAEVMLLLIPEAWQNNTEMEENAKAFWKFNSCLMEPWDGPALVVFTDGRQLGATLDRNGLRPGRYYVTTDDKLILASEVGVVDWEPANIKLKGRLQPGKMLLVDFEQQRLIPDEELKKMYAGRHDYKKFVKKGILDVKTLLEEEVAMWSYVGEKHFVQERNSSCVCMSLMYFF